MNETGLNRFISVAVT